LDKSVKNEMPVYENMWNIVDNTVHLIGSICDDCGEVYFPQKEIQICSNCQSEKISLIDLGDEGKIFSYTVVHQMPAGGYYKGTVPFVYAIVEMPAGVHVQTHLINIDPENIKIGGKVKAVIDTLFEDEETKTLTYKFEPIACERGK